MLQTVKRVRKDDTVLSFPKLSTKVFRPMNF